MHSNVRAYVTYMSHDMNVCQPWGRTLTLPFTNPVKPVTQSLPSPHQIGHHLTKTGDSQVAQTELPLGLQLAAFLPQQVIYRRNEGVKDEHTSLVRTRKSMGRQRVIWELTEAP